MRRYELHAGKVQGTLEVLWNYRQHRRAEIADLQEDLKYAENPITREEIQKAIKSRQGDIDDITERLGENQGRH